MNCSANNLEGVIHVGSGNHITFDNVELVENGDLGNNNSIIFIESEAKINITNNCSFSNNKGGVMVVGDESEVIIENSMFINNSARTNGAVLSTEDNGGAHLSITGSRFEGNVAEYHGGAIYMNRSLGLNVSDSLFQNNLCRLGNGGAIFISQSKNSVAQIQRTLFKGNSANGIIGRGGAIAFKHTGKSREQVFDLGPDVLFLKNTARVSGGALLVYNTNGRIHVSATFIGNSAEGAAGGLHLLFPDDRKGTNDYTNAALNAANFISNRAPVRGGGALYVYNHIELRTLDSNFTKNNARHGGAIFLDDTKRSIEIMRSNFTENGANTSGGSIYMIGTTNVGIIASFFKYNVGKRGGAVSVDKGKRLDVNMCTFVENCADYGGGAFNIENSEELRGKELKTDLTNSTFLNNKSNVTGSRDGFGGAMRLSGAGVETNLSNCHFESNEAKWGGSIYIDEAFDTEMHNTNYSKNVADLGGAIYVVPLERKLRGKNDLTRLTSCFLDENEAKRGGAIFIRPDRPFPEIIFASSSFSLAIINSRLFRNRAKEVGGGLFMALVNVNISVSVFKENTAKNNDPMNVGRFQDIIRHSGGALYVSRGSLITLSETSFTANVADGNGGAVCIADALLKCTNNCTFQANKGHSGGGIFGALSSANNDSRHLALLQCTSCLFATNKAQKGGGIYASIPASLSNVRDSWMNHNATRNQMLASGTTVANESYTNVIYLNPLQMQNNSAEITGRSIFTTEPFAVTVVTEKKETKNLVEYVNGTKNENDGVYDFSSIAHTVKNESKPLRGLNRGNTGQEFGSLKFRILDYFGQTVKGSRIVVELRLCPNSSLECCSTGRVRDQEENSSIAEVVASRNTNEGEINFRGQEISDDSSGEAGYPLWACFIEEEQEQSSLEDIFVDITFRGCYRMEKRNSETGNCEECDSGQYYEQKTNNDCEICPPDARCKGLTIIPNPGFWHLTSVSDKIYQCRPKEACTVDKNNSRRDAATNAHKEGDILTFNDTLYNQCKSGYEGLICGSCQKNHGRWNYICVKCYNAVAMWFLLLITFVWNLVLLLVLIFSARSLVSRLHFNIQVASQHPRYDAPASSSEQRPMQQIEMIPRIPDTFNIRNFVPESFPIVSESRTVEINTERQITPSRSVFRRRRFLEIIPPEPLPLANPLSETFKIVLNFIQVIYLAALLSEDLPGFFRWSIIPFDLLNLTETVFLIADCLLKGSGDRAIIRMTLQALFPLLLFLLICLVPTMLLIFKRNINFGLKDVQLMALCTIYLYFGPQIRTLFRFLDAVNVDDEDLNSHTSSFWSIDTSVKFLHSAHAYIVGFIVFPLLLVLVIVFPSSLFVTLKKHKERMQEEDVVSIYGFLYKGYEPAYYYWEIVIVIRKTLIAILFVFVHDAELQSVFVALTLVLFLSLQLVVNPFSSSFPGLNRLESLSLGVSTIVFLGVTLMLQSKEIEMKFLLYSIAWVTLLILFVTALVMITGLNVAMLEFLNDKLVESRLCQDKRSAESLPISKKLHKLAGFYFRRFCSCLTPRSDNQESANGGVHV
eukprot:g3602.t1